MIPSRKWFPASLAEQAGWFQNFSNQFAVLAPSLGFTPADVAAVQADNAAIQWMARNAGAMRSFDRAMVAYRNHVLTAKNGAPAATLPTPPVFGAVPEVDPGIFERLSDLVKRIRAAPSYSEEEASALGIVPAKPEGLVTSETRPNIRSTTLPGNVVKIAFKRGRTEGISVEMDVDNTGTWEPAARFYKSPGEIAIPQNAQATARSVKLRARYLLDNRPAGQYSEIETISTVP
ncbi:MAG TPA: hypothetical protein PKD24_05295 [Pyrinomonadaceae bacterium]|nr:hypothetical protein [Pyrinomonadaceae bacterium]HMP64966.1 hypothetical protein [Pyrinomonadaceae bacterium]